MVVEHTMALMVRPEATLENIAKSVLTVMTLKFSNQIMSKKNAVESVMLQTDGYTIQDGKQNICLVDSFIDQDPVMVVVPGQESKFRVPAKKFYRRKTQIIAHETVAGGFVKNSSTAFRRQDTLIDVITSTENSEKYLGLNGPKQVLKLRAVLVVSEDILKHNTFHEGLPITDRRQCLLLFLETIEKQNKER